jgi:hypothetical protein
MKTTILALPVAALVAVGFVACSEAPTGLAPDGPNDQLIAGGLTAAQQPDVTVYASFTVKFDGNSGVRESGPILNPQGKEIGSCGPGGVLINKNGKTTSAVAHPHCRTAGVDEIFSLEDIDAKESVHRDGQDRLVKTALLFTTELGSGPRVEYNHRSEHTEGVGVIEVWALKDDDPSGKFVIDLSTYDTEGNGMDKQNLLHGRCYIGTQFDDEEGDPLFPDVEENAGYWADCLNVEITADFYRDHTADVETATPDGHATGYLYWKPKTN